MSIPSLQCETTREVPLKELRSRQERKRKHKPQVVFSNVQSVLSHTAKASSFAL